MYCVFHVFFPYRGRLRVFGVVCVAINISSRYDSDPVARIFTRNSIMLHILSLHLPCRFRKKHSLCIKQWAVANVLSQRSDKNRMPARILGTGPTGGCRRLLPVERLVMKRNLTTARGTLHLCSPQQLDYKSQVYVEDGMSFSYMRKTMHMFGVTWSEYAVTPL